MSILLFRRSGVADHEAVFLAAVDEHFFLALLEKAHLQVQGPVAVVPEQVAVYGEELLQHPVVLGSQIRWCKLVDVSHCFISPLELWLEMSSRP